MGKRRVQGGSREDEDLSDSQNRFLSDSPSSEGSSSKGGEESEEGVFTSKRAVSSVRGSGKEGSASEGDSNVLLSVRMAKRKAPVAQKADSKGKKSGKVRGEGKGKRIQGSSDVKKGGKGTGGGAVCRREGKN